MNRALPEEYIFHLNLKKGKFLSFICTKEALKELTVGFLYNENLISDLDDILELKIDSDETNVDIILKDDRLAASGMVRTTGLGGIGFQKKIEEAKVPIKAVYDQQYILECLKQMDAGSVKHAKTGGMHCSALFNQKRMLALYEDISRHNTLDKLAGKCLLEQIDTSDSLLITTGRISEDMVKKASRIGVTVIASYKTPTQQAYEQAMNFGMTIIGSLRKMPFQVYCGENRIK